jgi:hypothetical protein
MDSSTDRVTPKVKMDAPTQRRWPVQQRLGFEGESELPEVWSTLGPDERAAVIDRLAQAMAKAAVAVVDEQGGEADGHIAADDEPGHVAEIA